MQYLWLVLTVITVLSILLSFHLRGKKMKEAVRELLGVGKRKIAGLFNEFKRKTFHLVGLLIPGLYYFFLKYNVLTRTQVCLILGGIAAFMFTCEILRFTSPAFRRVFMRVAGRIMRPKENNEINGSTWFVIGSFVTIYLFHPIIAIAALLFLNLGDLAAALVGRAYGRTKFSNGKSVEGALACLLTCLIAGMGTLYGVHLFEYIVFCGAIAATITELGLGIPSWVNDNLTIPVISGLAMTLAQQRLGVDIPFRDVGI